MAVENWNSAKIVRTTQRLTSQRLRLVGRFMVGDTKARISRQQPVSGGKGLAPSAEGTPPKRVTDELLGSIRSNVSNVPRGVLLKLIADTPYARRLALGFSGTDSLGRIINQGPRPFLRVTLSKALGELRRLIGRS